MLSISTKARMRELLSERRASLRVLKSMATLMKGRLNRQIHGFLSIGEVSKLMSALESMTNHADRLCAGVGFNPEEDEDVSIRRLLGSPEGRQIAGEFCSLERAIDGRVSSWDDGRELSRGQLLKMAASPLVVRDRILAEQFSAFCRQAESYVQLLRAQLTMQRLQIWLDGEKLCYSGEAEEVSAEGASSESPLGVKE